MTYGMCSGATHRREEGIIQLTRKANSIVTAICKMFPTDCRSLNKADLGRKLLDLLNVPTTAEITEIPLDWDGQVEICFVVPGNINVFSFYAGKWLDGSESCYLAIIGTQKEDNGKIWYDFFQIEEILPDDYFKKGESL